VKVKLTKMNIRIKIGEEIVSIVQFADNIVLIAESEDDIQRSVNEMNETFRPS